MRKFTSTDKQNITSRLFAFCLLIGTLMFMDSCRDATELDIPVPAPETENTRAELQTVQNPGGLIQQPDRTWKADNKRVPLVGVGREVNSFSGALLEVLEPGTDDFGNIVDTDLSNYTAFSSAGVTADLLSTELVSVRDVYRTYSKGQQVGFAYIEEEGVSVLSVELLKKMKIILRKDGKDVQTTPVSGNDNTLGVNLLSLGGLTGSKWAERSISVIANADFDEVVFDLGGVSISALKGSQFGIRYAFVGENPEIIASDGAPLNEYWTGGVPVINENTQSGITDYTQSLNNTSYITNSNSADYASHRFNISSLFLTNVRATVNFKREIPVGTEVGFKYSYSNTLLDLGILGKSGPGLYTYVNGEKYEDALQSVTPPMSLLNLGLDLGGEAPVYASMLVDNEKTKQVQLRLSGSLLDGGLGDLLGSLTGKTFNVFYAYVREPVAVDVSSYFSIDDMVIYGSSYTLPTTSTGSLSYNIITQPYGASASVSRNRLTGAVKEGAYVIQAIYTDNESVKGISHVFTVYRKMNQATGSGSRYITTSSNGAYPTEPISDEGGCLLCLFNGTNSLNALVDNNMDNYAVHTGLLDLIENAPVAAIEMTKPVNSSLQEIRTGFVVRANSGLLDVSLLNEFEIRLYNNGQLINTGETGTTGVLGVDLISGGTDKFRIYVNTDQQFDRIELWKRKGLGLALFNNFRMYGAFYEDASLKQGSTNEICMEGMDVMRHGLGIDYDNTGDGEKAVALNIVGAQYKGLSNLLDNDLSTGMDVNNVLTLLGKDAKVGLGFNPLPVSQPVGIVLEKEGLLDLSLLNSSITVTIMSGGKTICSERNLNVLDLNLLEAENRIYFEITPKYSLDEGITAETYDGIVIKLGTGLIDLSLNTLKVTGIYTRSDENNNGIPDCMETESETPLAIGEAHACEGEPLVIPVETEAKVGSEYMLLFENRSSGESYERYLDIKQSGNNKIFSVEGIPYGIYYVSVYSLGSGEPLYNKANAYIHAKLTEWTGAADTDWNNWENWTKGIPGSCTDVILRKDAAQYPALDAESGTYSCDRIHFEAGSTLVRSDRLTYTMAFVDVMLEGGNYSYFVSPLQETYTGDMFVNPSVSWSIDKYFTVPDENSYPQMRTSPVVYQQASIQAYDYDGSGHTSVVQQDGFTQDFNGVAHKYSETALYKIKAGDNSGSAYYFRLPKGHEGYNYFSPDGVAKDGVYQRTDRTGNSGKLYTGSYTFTPANGRMFVTNPYMAYITVDIPAGASVKSYSEGMYYSTAYVGRSRVSTGESVMSAGSSYLIPPMSGIIIEGVGLSSITIRPDMQCTKPATTGAYALSRNSSATGNEPEGVLKVVAESRDKSSSCILYRSSEASNSLKEGEDVRTMVDAIEAPVVAVYSMADGKAADIQQFADMKRIDLGLILRSAGTVRLKFIQDGTWDDWYLLDRQTSRVYFLNEAVEVVLENATSANNRLSLIKK